MGIPFNGTLYANNSNFDWYGGCSKCYQFSMLFGSSPNNIGVITSDEDFEKYKMQFVEHYNEKHRDLHEWKKNKKGKKPITNKENMERLQRRIPLNPFSPAGFTGSISFDLTGASNISFITDEGREAFGTSMFHSLARPEITAEDKAILDKVEKKGEIKNDDLKRINKKYGKSLIEDAMKKYRKNLMTRRLPRRGWRD